MNIYKIKDLAGYRFANISNKEFAKEIGDKEFLVQIDGDGDVTRISFDGEIWLAAEDIASYFEEVIFTCDELYRFCKPVKKLVLDSGELKVTSL